MPVVDTNRYPEWWHALKKEYEKIGVRPVVI